MSGLDVSELVPKITLLTCRLHCLLRTAKKILKKNTVEAPLPPHFLKIPDLLFLVFKLTLNLKNK